MSPGEITKSGRGGQIYPNLAGIQTKQGLRSVYVNDPRDNHLYSFPSVTNPPSYRYDTENSAKVLSSRYEEAQVTVHWFKSRVLFTPTTRRFSEYSLRTDPENRNKIPTSLVPDLSLRDQFHCDVFSLVVSVIE